VTGVQELINTGDSVTGQTVDRTFINDLPLLSRSAFDLAFLAPGITQPTSFAFGQTAIRYITSNNFVSNGSRNATSDILIDGITTAEFVVGGLAMFSSYQPSVTPCRSSKCSNPILARNLDSPGPRW